MSPLATDPELAIAQQNSPQAKSHLMSEKLRYSVSLVTQGDHRFYTLTMPSDVLARTCFVTNRSEDPIKGFQRLLDSDRARQIAEYIDKGFGSIPNSIVLSAQPEAELQVIGRGKTLEFRDSKKAFLVLDGQHRVYGFTMAKKPLRVPVVIYNGLSRQDETKLFIDINTKQRPVPNELLLDIKRLADYETNQEKVLGAVFDLFSERTDSPLLGLMSSSTRASGKISRVTFYAGLKPLMSVFGEADAETVYNALQAYLRAFIEGIWQRGVKVGITNPTILRGVMLTFPEVARRVKDRFAADYSQSNFSEVMQPMTQRAKLALFRQPGNSHKALHEVLVKALQTDFTL